MHWPFRRFPLVRQHDIMQCGAACLAMICRFHTERVLQDMQHDRKELRTYIHTCPWTSWENIKHLCKMGIVSMSNKRRRTPLIDNNFILNAIYTTLLTVKYNKKAYARLKKENETTSSGIICKRYRVLMAKMSEPKLSSGRIAAITGCSRNFVDNCRSLFFCHG